MWKDICQVIGCMYIACMAALGSWIWIFAWLRRAGLTWMGYTWVFILAVMLTGCTQIKEFTVKDAQAAKTRAMRWGDKPGALCWEYIEMTLSNGASDLEIAGIMDAIEAARIARLKAPAWRKEATDNCGEVFADVLIELAKRGARRGL